MMARGQDARKEQTRGRSRRRSSSKPLERSSKSFRSLSVRARVYCREPSTRMALKLHHVHRIPGALFDLGLASLDDDRATMFVHQVGRVRRQPSPEAVILGRGVALLVLLLVREGEGRTTATSRDVLDHKDDLKRERVGVRRACQLQPGVGGRTSQAGAGKRTVGPL